MRYQLEDSPIHHPYFQRRDSVTGKYSPKIVEGRGIYDTVDRKWVVEPTEKSKVKPAMARELNGMKPLTTAKVVAVLRKQRMPIASYIRSSRVRGWGHWTAGAHVRTNEFGQIVVSYTESHWGKTTPEQEAAIVAGYMTALYDAGIEGSGDADGRCFRV